MEGLLNILNATFWLWVVLGPLIGAAIGQKKGRLGAGIFFGFLLGPIGWLVIAVGPDNRRKCPECKGVVPEGARKCMHCGTDL